MNNRVIQKIMIVSFIIFLFAGGIYTGYKISRMKTEQKEYCTVNAIAVVNLDEGILEEGSRVNYGAKLGQLPDVNFAYTGLEEARLGVDDKRYAAYVLIPSTFSETVVSINRQPEKAPIEYRISPYLKENLAIDIFAQVVSYIQLVNDNLSYLYIDAILEEFHKAQNDAVTVMNNDNKDMESISSIQEQELLAPLDFSEITYIENIIAPINLEPEYQKMNELVVEIEGEYEAGYQDAQEEFANIKTGEESMVKALEGLSDYIGKIDIQNGADGILVYQQGMDQLKELIEQAKKDSIEARKKTTDLLKWENLGGVPEDPNRTKSLYEIIQEQDEEIQEQNKQIEEQIEIIQDIVSDPAGSGNTTITRETLMLPADLAEETEQETQEEEKEEDIGNSVSNNNLPKAAPSSSGTSLQQNSQIQQTI